MRFRLAAAATVTVMVGALVTGCSGSGGGDDKTFQFWSFTGINQKADVEKYKEAHPDITVKLTEVGSTQETAQALTAALAGGKVPDLVLIQGDDMPNFVANPDNFVDLSTMGADDISGDYLPWVWDQAVAQNDAVIGVPTDVGGMSMAYRADLFEAAGLPSEPDAVAALWPTWDDFISVGQQYVAATGKPFLDNAGTSVFFQTVNQVDEKYYTPEGELVYDTNPQVKEAFDISIKAIEAGITANVPAFSTGWSTGKTNGAFAAMAAPSWMLKSIKTDAPDTSGQWRVTTVPKVAGNWGGSYLAIPKRASNPEAAWAYIKEMQSPESQLKNFTDTGALPSTVSAYESTAIADYTDPFFGDSKIGAVLGKSLQEFKPFFNGPETATIGSAMINTVTDVEAGNTPPDKAWDVAMKAVKDALGG